MKMLRLTVLAAAAVGALAADNGLGITPPMGFRNWNQWQRAIDQPTMESIFRALADRSRTVAGVPTSLADLGYRDAGLDDAWQNCSSYGPNKYTYHDAAGNPVVNTTRFPSMKGMVDYGHSLNLTVGWYHNNCICADHCTDESCYAGDVNALTAAGFDSVKLDGCGKEFDLTMWYNLINATGKPVTIENCHWGFTLPNATWCPWNFYRASTDARPTYGSVLLNLNALAPIADTNLSTPGCWAYADMLEVGVTNTQDGHPPLSFTESRTNFGAWSIVSSPLVIGFNVTDGPTVDFAWPIISNKEAIAINQAWTGFSGSIFASSPVNASFVNCSWLSKDKQCSYPSWQYLYKPLPGGKTAVLMMNNANTTATLTLNFASVPGLAGIGATPVAVRDVWQQADIGTFTKSWTAVKLESHDSAFLVLTPQ